jgi:PAS domain S-box-containing protein
VVASMEVTDRVRAEREKQAAQEQMTELLRLHEASFNQSLTCLVLLDRDFNFLQVNEAYARSCGMQVVDFAGRNHFELFPSDAQDIFEEVVRTKEPSIVTARPFSFPDHPEWGVTYWDWVLQPILDEQGEVHFLLWMLQDVTHRREAEDALMEYQQDLRFMASELALAEERARRAIAVEIHDGLGQHLAVMRMKLANLRQTAILPEVRQMASDLLEHLGEAIHYARFLTFELSPPVLYDLGLEPALGWLTDQFRTRHGLDLTLEDDGLPKPLSQDLRVTVFRSARELLTNVVKHAQAEHVKVSVTSDGTRLHVEVEDDGCGFDTSMLEGQHPQQGGFGLFSVIERMRHLGGSVEIVSQPGGGTRARLSAPLEEAAAGCEEEFV